VLLDCDVRQVDIRVVDVAGVRAVLHLWPYQPSARAAHRAPTALSVVGAARVRVGPWATDRAETRKALLVHPGLEWAVARDEAVESQVELLPRDKKWAVDVA
jgi:hypothetical protein